MDKTIEKIRHFVLLLSALLFSIFVFDQANAQAPYFLVEVKFKVETGNLDYANVLVEKNGERDRSISPRRNGKFDYELDFNSIYVFTFKKPGYVTKRIKIDTKIPPDRINDPFAVFVFTVSLFEQYDDINTIVFNQPVGVIKYSDEIADFDYDTDYTKSIQSQLDEVMEKVKEKQEEQKREEKETRKEPEKKEEPPPPPPEQKEEEKRVSPAVQAEEQKKTPSANPLYENRTKRDPGNRKKDQKVVAEANKYTVYVTIFEEDGSSIEYKKVVHKWGGVFYFKDGVSCSEDLFLEETTLE